jgi:hypothetical protein
MKITSGEYEIFESGTVINFEEEPITFELEDLKVTLLFKDDSDKKKNHDLEFNPISPKELEIILINFNNPLGTGTKSPISIGRLNDRKLYLNFRVYDSLNKKSNKTIDYCWYLGKEVQDVE